MFAPIHPLCALASRDARMLLPVITLTRRLSCRPVTSRLARSDDRPCLLLRFKEPCQASCRRLPAAIAAA